MLVDTRCLFSERFYHKQCMTCSVCGDSLNGTYFTFLNKLICEKDYNVSVQKFVLEPGSC